jgi:histidyl-tRNA synthetase
MRDFLPDDVRRREYVIGVIKRVYERYGFEPLETPAVENIDTLMGKYGDEGNQLIFKILMRGEHEATGKADLALRYDLTVPLARVVAHHRSKLPRLFKRYQIQPVWRADRPARGRFREFYQCDVDALGSTSPVVEAELCAAVSDALTELGFGDFVIRLNHRQLLASLLSAAGVDAAAQGDALVAIDKLDKIGADGVREELARRGIGEESRRALLEFFQPGAIDIALDRVAGFVGEDPAGRAALENLQSIVSLAAGTSAAGRIRVDPSLARGLSYYTGAIMEINVPDLAGSLGGGGRYDNLVGMFSREAIPACGFSLGLERILVVMSERGMFPPDASPRTVDVLVTMWSVETASDSLDIAARLRAEGFRVEVYPDPVKVGKQLKFAAERRASVVVIRGENRSRDVLQVKDLETGVQGVFTFEALVQHLRARRDESTPAANDGPKPVARRPETE